MMRVIVDQNYITAVGSSEWVRGDWGGEVSCINRGWERLYLNTCIVRRTFCGEERHVRGQPHAWRGVPSDCV